MLSRYFSAHPWIAVPALALLFSAPAAGQQELHPIAAQVKAEVKDPARPFTLLLRVQVKDGMQQQFEAAFARASKATRNDKGSLTYDLNRDARDPTRYVVYERWQNLDDLEAHLRTPHITTLLGELKDLLAGAPEVKVLVPVGE